MISSAARKNIGAIILIALLGCVLYLNVLSAEFIWDDNYLVKHNSYIRHWSHAGKAFTQDIGSGSRKG